GVAARAADADHLDDRPRYLTVDYFEHVVVSLPLLLTSKIALKPLPHTPQHGPHRAALARKLAVMQLRRPFKQQSHRGCIARRPHDIGESAGIARHADPHRHVENLFTELTMPRITAEPPVSTTPLDSSSSNPDSRSTCWTSE